MALRKPICRLLLLYLATTSIPAVAGLIVTAEQVGANVVFNASGELDLSAWTKSATDTRIAGVWASRSVLSLGPTSPFVYDVDVYANPVNFNGPTSFGSGDFFLPSSGFGDTLYLANDVVFPTPTNLLLAVPVGHSLNDELSSTMTFAGKTIASLGMTPGNYVWSWGSGDTFDSWTLNVVDPSPPAPVPEPGTWAMLCAGILCLAVTRRNRRKRARFTR